MGIAFACKGCGTNYDRRADAQACERSHGAAGSYVRWWAVVYGLDRRTLPYCFLYSTREEADAHQKRVDEVDPGPVYVIACNGGFDKEEAS